MADKTKEAFSRGLNKVPDAPIYHAKPEEMKDISVLMANASSLAIRYGAVRIDPPPGWELPLLRMRSDSRFFVRVQAFPEAPFVSSSLAKLSDETRIKRDRTRRIIDDDDDDDDDDGDGLIDEGQDSDSDKQFTVQGHSSKTALTIASNASEGATNLPKRGPFSNALIIPKRSQAPRRLKNANSNPTSGAGEIVLLDDLNPSTGNQVNSARLSSATRQISPNLQEQQCPELANTSSPTFCPAAPPGPSENTNTVPEPTTLHVRVETMGVVRTKPMPDVGTESVPAPTLNCAPMYQAPPTTNKVRTDDVVQPAPQKALSAQSEGTHVTTLPSAIAGPCTVFPPRPMNSSQPYAGQLNESTDATVAPVPPEHSVAFTSCGAKTPVLPAMPTTRRSASVNCAMPPTQHHCATGPVLSAPPVQTAVRPKPVPTQNISQSIPMIQELPKHVPLANKPATPDENEQGYFHGQSSSELSPQTSTVRKKSLTKVDVVSISNLCSSPSNMSPTFSNPLKNRIAKQDLQTLGANSPSPLTLQGASPAALVNGVKGSHADVAGSDHDFRIDRKRSYSLLDPSGASHLDSEQTQSQSGSLKVTDTRVPNTSMTNPSGTSARTTGEPRSTQVDLVAELDSLPPVPRKTVPIPEYSDHGPLLSHESEGYRRTFSRFQGNQKNKTVEKRCDQKFSRMVRPASHDRECSDVCDRHGTSTNRSLSDSWVKEQSEPADILQHGYVRNGVIQAGNAGARGRFPMEIDYSVSTPSSEPAHPWRGSLDKLNSGNSLSMGRDVSGTALLCGASSRTMRKDENGNWHTVEEPSFPDGSSNSSGVIRASSQHSPPRRQKCGPRFPDLRVSHPSRVPQPPIIPAGITEASNARPSGPGAAAPTANSFSKSNPNVVNADHICTSLSRGDMGKASGSLKIGAANPFSPQLMRPNKKLDAEGLARKHFARRVVESVLECCIDQAVQDTMSKNMAKTEREIETEDEVQEVCVRRMGRTRERRAKMETTGVKKAIEKKSEKRVTKKRHNAISIPKYNQDEQGRLTLPVVFPDSATPVSFSSFKKSATSFFGHMQKRLGGSIRAVSRAERKSESNESLIKRADSVEREFFKALEGGINGEKFDVSYGVDVESEGAFDRNINRYVEWRGPTEIVNGPGRPEGTSKEKAGVKKEASAGRSGSVNGREEEEIVLEEGRAEEFEEVDEIPKESRRANTIRRNLAKSHVGNLNRSGVLRHLPLMPGINHTMFYVGQLFTRFCWHTEDAYLNSVSYLHELSEGEKVWYAVPPKDADAFEKYAQSNVFAPNLVSNKDDAQALFMNKTTIFNPANLLDHKIEVYRVVHKVGSFVLTAPRGYHAGFNCGFNVAEAVNFAQAPWFPVGRDASRFARSIQRPLCVPWEYLLFHEAKAISETYKRGLPANPSDRSRVRKDASIVALELRKLLARGEELIRAHALRTNCRVTMMKDAMTIVRESQLGPEFGHGAGMTCFLCSHACHFFAEVCGSCESNPNAKCMLHFSSTGQKVCKLNGHKGIIVRRHDPLRLLDILESLERLGSVEVSIEERYKRMTEFVRTWETPMRRSSGLRLKLSLVVAASRIPPDMKDEDNGVENHSLEDKTTKKRPKREVEISNDRDRKKARREKRPVKRIVNVDVDVDGDGDGDGDNVLVIPKSNKR